MALKQVFKMKDLGELKYFLVIEFARNNSGILMNQRKYSLELISELALSISKPVSISMDTNVKLATKEYDDKLEDKGPEDPLLADVSSYHRLIGKLLYLTVTRPDIAFSVQTLIQYLQQPKKISYGCSNKKCEIHQVTTRTRNPYI
ncbi:uncharacterized mitochondrial protein AtMg00810-like [Lycium barbarum]|uniref:uncharacterized mitochondrial protein AtMg00810-like n=1 Tax=Lycium barbarum TaxID=112863 RepID=UPI00293E81F0|nr:uncharacterized mitochondrial protein AtMg00810-like [Lycium barbarum]